MFAWGLGQLWKCISFPMFLCGECRFNEFFVKLLKQIQKSTLIQVVQFKQVFQIKDFEIRVRVCRVMLFCYNFSESINQMGSNLLLFLAFTLTALAQIVRSPPKTLLDLQKSEGIDPTKEKAIEFLLRSYPELINFTDINVSLINRTGNSDRINLIDYYFTLSQNQTKVSVIATLSQTPPGEFISISPLVTTVADSNNFSSTETQGRDYSNYFLISNNEVKEIAISNRSSQSAALGAFQVFSNASDVRLDRALGFVESLHPEMVNYEVQRVQYQVVSGINFLIDYQGFDMLTRITALVYVNLNLQPNLINFVVRCQEYNISGMEIACSDDIAFKIFSANEALLLTHPELLSYQLISMISDDTYVTDGILFVLTFENRVERMRIMAEINIQSNVFSIMAYYTYAYPQ